MTKVKDWWTQRRRMGLAALDEAKGDMKQATAMLEKEKVKGANWLVWEVKKRADEVGRPESKPESGKPISKAPEKVGQATSQPSAKEIIIGTLRMPYEDWGFSNSANMLIVAYEYQRAKQDGFDGKVGDLCAFYISALNGYLKRVEEVQNGIGIREEETRAVELIGQTIESGAE